MFAGLLNKEEIHDKSEHDNDGPGECGGKGPFDQAQMAAVAYLARYSGRTLETYRYDVRVFFQWCADVGLAVLEATRPHIELWRTDMEQRGLATSTIDRRLSTICGLYRFAHIDGRIAANPAQYVPRPKVYPSEVRGLTEASSARSSSPPIAMTQPRRPGDAARPQRTAGERGLCHQCRGPGLSPGAPDAATGRETSRPSSLVPRVARTIDLAIGERARVRSCTAATGYGWTDARRTAGCGPSARRPGSATSTPTCCVAPSSWRRSMPAYRCVMSRSPHATLIRGPRPSMTGGGRTSTVTPPTSWSPSWPAVRADAPAT